MISLKLFLKVAFVHRPIKIDVMRTKVIVLVHVFSVEL